MPAHRLLEGHREGRVTFRSRPPAGPGQPAGTQWRAGGGRGDVAVANSSEGRDPPGAIRQEPGPARWWTQARQWSAFTLGVLVIAITAPVILVLVWRPFAVGSFGLALVVLALPLVLALLWTWRGGSPAPHRFVMGYALGAVLIVAFLDDYASLLTRIP